MGFSQTRNSLKVSQPCGLKNDLLCSRPLRACSNLENRELSHFCIAHCVRWVAWLYQEISLVLSRWMRQASSTALPEAFTCPATLDRPGRLGARSLHLSCRFRLARSTALFETLSLDSLTRFGTVAGVPCVPRGTQGKQKPQGPGRGGRGRRVEDQLEEPTRWRHTRSTLRKQGGKTPKVYLKKKTTGSVKDPLLPSLWVFFLSISHPYGMIVQTANLVDSKKNDNRSRETEGTTCQGLSDEPDCRLCRTKDGNKERPLPSPL